MGLPTIDVTPGVGRTINTPVAGRQLASDSQGVVLSVEDLAAINAIAAKLSGDPATDSGLLSIFNKLSSDPASQTTLAAVLAKLPTAPATETSLAAILAKLTADPATQTTLAAILAKLIVGPSTEATLAAVSGKLPATLGSKAAASSLSVAMSTEDAATRGALTETAPASDTASSGLNGRLQRIAQRITALIALVPTSLGAKAAAASLAVTLSTEDRAALATDATVARTASADNWAAVTPSDVTDLATIPKALYIGGAGNITVNGADGSPATFVVLAGQILPIRARRVKATGTTATGIVALS